MKNLYLVYDTETTGLPKNWSAPITDHANWPRLVQLCFGLYNEKGQEISFSNFIIKPEGFTIPDEAAIIHGITTERALEEGIELSKAIGALTIATTLATHAVAHNVGFDKKIVGAEFSRNGMSMIDMPEHDTMITGTNVCKLTGKNSSYKWPKLNELHKYLFAEEFAGAHDAMNDVRACARCFFELKKRNLI